MPTHPIGKNTVNLSLNMPRAERMLLGRLAFRRRKSLSAYLRGLALRGLLADSPADAALLIRIREGRR